MHGNVWEWCLDWSGGSITGDDLVGPSSGTKRRLCGGSWNANAFWCRTVSGSDCAPSSSGNDDVGFRLVRMLQNGDGSHCGVLCYGESRLKLIDHTVTTPEPVPYLYLDAACPTLLAEHGGDYEAAAKATASNGHNIVWECYVAGISPTNETAQFTAKIELKDGGPVVTWEPDLNTNGIIRTYKVYGSETLNNGGNWQYPTNSLHRFFKVKVEMPQFRARPLHRRSG